MTLPPDDKNFRLSQAIRPAGYRATVTIDLEHKRFSGRIAIDVVLEAQTSQIFLHAVDLEVLSVHSTSGGTSHEGTATPRPLSETILLEFPEALGPGSHTLTVDWKGSFNTGLRGLYKAGPLAVTQFEAADARRVFPCFDEPAFKAPWRIVIKAPKDVQVLSNGLPIAEEREGEWQTIAFRETPPLPTYLIALVCGRLASSEPATACGAPLRTWAVPEKVHLTHFAQEVAQAVLPLLEEYFGVPYAFSKLDQVAVPDFEAGAMENAGLVTYRETALLLDPKTASLPTQKRVAEVITHELAHQWFGNWVTMAWWDDLWLNEAFATWMAYKILAGWRPKWRLWLDFEAGKAEALALDALGSTHPIRAEIPNAEAAGESFDAITYEKGGAVLRMIEGYLGEAPFAAGIRQYMQTYAQKNATCDDLWRALEQASSEPVLELASAWIRQSGYPLVSATLEGNQLLLAQSRFFSEPGREGQETWPVPLVLKFEDAEGIREQRVFLRERMIRISLAAQGDPKWVCANAGGLGFYRVAYDSHTLARVAAFRDKLEPAERTAVLADAWALVRAKRMPISSFLDLVRSFEQEEDEAVLGEIVSRLATLEHRLVSDADRVLFRRFVGDLLRPPLARVGFDGTPGEEDEIRLRRAALVRGVAGVARGEDAHRELGVRLDRFLQGDLGALEPNLHDIAVYVVARNGDEARFDQFMSRFRAESDPVFKRRYLLALPAFEEAPLAVRARGLVWDNQVPTQDFSSFVAVLLGNPIAREPFWTELRKGWPRVLERLSGAPALLRRVIESVSQLPERHHYEEAQAFFGKHPVPSAEQAIAQTLERMEQQVELRERTQPEIGAWLEA